MLGLMTDPDAETRGYIDGQMLASEMASIWRGEQNRPDYWFTLALGCGFGGTGPDAPRSGRDRRRLG